MDVHFVQSSDGYVICFIEGREYARADIGHSARMITEPSVWVLAEPAKDESVNINRKGRVADAFNFCQRL